MGLHVHHKAEAHDCRRQPVAGIIWVQQKCEAIMHRNPTNNPLKGPNPQLIGSLTKLDDETPCPFSP